MILSVYITATAAMTKIKEKNRFRFSPSINQPLSSGDASIKTFLIQLGNLLLKQCIISKDCSLYDFRSSGQGVSGIYQSRPRVGRISRMRIQSSVSDGRSVRLPLAVRSSCFCAGVAAAY